MNKKVRTMLLVGDNPFHGISHLSQEQARSRADGDVSAADKADLILTAVENGATGFMFSVSDLTLTILKTLREREKIDKLELHAIVPYVFEYVRIATQTGTPGLAKNVVKQMALSGDVQAIFGGLNGAFRMKPESLLKTYVSYEINKIKAAAGKKANLSSVLLHEVLTDMGLALNFDWLFKSFTSFLSKKGITPGFNTRNLPLFVRKFNEWNINLDQTLIATPFNKAGFQMNPSRTEFENTLSNISSPIVLAISVLAAGYFKPPEAVAYLANLSNLKGVVAGVSKESHARETFKLFDERLNKNI
ncbi:MAG: hypothetical protein NWF06_07925 [Candidatus Bathyarchaeota archaeon]|nr:hypothetical protein [Candidatus Bathyarchaeum sp.]